MSKYFIALVAALAVAGLGLAGCHKSENPPPANQQTSPSQQIKQGAQSMGQGIMAAGKKVGRQATDAAITARVKGRLVANQGLSGFTIHVTTNHGIVTLTGTVDRASKRDLAGQVAANTDGVKGVNNDIVVAPNAGG